MGWKWVKKKSHLTVCDVSLSYTKNKSDPKLEPLGTPQDTDAGWYLLN